MIKKQLNTELPEASRTRIKTDAVRLGVNLGDWVRVASEKFLAMPIEHRRAALTGSRKLTGRKIGD